MIYVCPHCKHHEQRLNSISGIGRLFAFPTIPTNAENKTQLTILDSGAFALRGKQMTTGYMEQLSKHYETYYTENTICVAPDVVNLPVKTMQNYSKWMGHGFFQGISPVIQPTGKYNFSVNDYKAQIRYYASRYHPKTMLFSNWLCANDAIGLGICDAVSYAKQNGVEWVHILGAGWNKQDVLRWASVGVIDSIDSIAYYTSGCRERFGNDDPVKNARCIKECLKKYQ